MVSGRTRQLTRMKPARLDDARPASLGDATLLAAHGGDVKGNGCSLIEDIPIVGAILDARAVYGRNAAP
jgi:hypothetical protein